MNKTRIILQGPIGYEDKTGMTFLTCQRRLVNILEKKGTNVTR